VNPPKLVTTGVRSRKPPVWLCVTVNVLAFPGLGTIMAGRREGYVQAVIMVGGFILTVGFFIVYLAAVVHYLQNPLRPEAEFHAAYRRYLWALYVGAGCSVASWVWALVSSFCFYRSQASASPHNSR